jgi:uncharacterized OsmC-like protein
MTTEAARSVKVVNGVNVDQLFETVDTVRRDASVAKFRFRARNRWVEGGLNRTTIDDFDGACATHRRREPFVLAADEPPVLLGLDRGPNPVEYALTALAGCLTTAIVYHAAARGYRLEEVESTLEGDLDLRGFLGVDPAVPRGYEAVRVTFRIKGDVPEDELEEICRMGPRYSPVHDIFTRAIPVTVGLARD